MGTIMAGEIYTSANPQYTPQELAHQLRLTDPAVVLTAELLWEKAVKGAELAAMSTDKLYLFAEPSWDNSPYSTPVDTHDRQGFSELLVSADIGAKFEWEELNTPQKSSRGALLLFSSGTTGSPKGVEVSHYAIVANMAQLNIMRTLTKSKPASCYNKKGLGCLPMYHAFGLFHYTFILPKAGVEAYLMERWNVDEVLTHIQNFKITELVMVPPMVLAMVKHPQIHQFDLSNVRKVSVGAAPLGRELTTQFESLWKGGVRIRQVWGMSEQPVMTTCWHEDDALEPSSTSVGELIPGCEAIIMRPDGTEETRVRERGEIWMRGPNIMNGYWRNSEATKGTINDQGWLMTGDVAFVDEHGRFHIVDRIKELIKVKGAQVAPAELEATLLEHVKVVDVAVVGVRTEADNELPRAYIVRQDKTLTSASLLTWANGRLSKYKRITGGFIFVDSIPKSPSGKILRRELRERARNESPGEVSPEIMSKI
ncbi:hypothetical protein FACUT_13664 [Fusarium acutatum]|uniref:Uncharacterized protein n=1 Tax=Fusarium acutatum TaxID=78861 RepID=A0A8H4J8R6_9HYPO|nr:hypothetical protein FACUT_13664 [Fusarium acutatum]